MNPFWAGVLVGFFIPWVLTSMVLVTYAVVKTLKGRQQKQQTGATKNDVRR